jgi:SAM-dependent methyltransferase
LPGVDLDPRAREWTEGICEDVVIGNLDTMDLAAALGEQRFDVVLMLDVLEHLRDPAILLERVGAVLAEGGWAVISLPNVAHISLRLSLLEGRFRYSDVGLLDRTHLRFFDRAGIDELLAEAGWAMFDLARVTRHLGTTEIEVEGADPATVAELESDVEALTYQFVLAAAPLGSPVLDRPPVLPAAIAQATLLTAIGRIAELDAEVAALRQVHIPDLWGELEQIRAGSLERRGHLKHLLAALRENAERLGRQA